MLEDSRDKFGLAPDANLLVKRPELVSDGVNASASMPTDVDKALAANEHISNLKLGVGEGIAPFQIYENVSCGWPQNKQANRYVFDKFTDRRRMGTRFGERP